MPIRKVTAATDDQPASSSVLANVPEVAKVADDKSASATPERAAPDRFTASVLLDVMGKSV
jgi:hypothetical protein